MGPASGARQLDQSWGISTPMGSSELDSARGDAKRELIAASIVGRVGTPSDVAAAAEFLLGPNSTFITGTDLLVDGGTVAAISCRPA